MAEASRRSTCGPAALGGLAAGIAAAVVGNRDWVSIDDAATGSGDVAFASTLSIGGDFSAPPVTATALVLLASWGVLLVSRGRFRRGIAWLGLASAIAVLGFAVAAWLGLPRDVADDLANLEIEVGRSVWAHLGVLAGAVAVATSLLAVRGVGRWPEMGRRYDAPDGSTPPVADAAPEDQSSLDLWKALDEGRDPTEGPRS